MATAEQITQHLNRRRNALVTEAAEALAQEIAAYGAFPREVLDGDISDVIRHNVEMFIDAARTGAPPSRETLERIRGSAARRAEEQVPLDMMVSAYPLATRLIMERVIGELAEREGADETVPVDFVGRLLEFLRIVVIDAIGGYLEEYTLIQALSETGERRALDALLAGRDVDPAGDVELADSYRVLALEVGPHPDEQVEGVNAVMAARRKLRRLRATLAEMSGDRQLASLTPEGGLVLLPEPVPAAWLERLTAAAGASIVAGCASAARSEVPDAVRLARDVLDLVRMLDRGPGSYEIGDVAFEYQATRPGPARDALLERIRPITDDSELLRTLRGYLSAGGNRSRAARVVGAHPNTIDNRIRKIAGLIGHEPTDPAIAAHLRMALLAYDASTRE